QPTPPRQQRPTGPPAAATPAAGPPVKPAVNNPPPNNNPPAAPKGRGFAVIVQPESVKLAVGSTAKVTVKLERKEYQGGISLSWSGAKGIKISPSGPITLQPGNTDPVLTLTTLSEPPDPNLQLNLVATAMHDPQRQPVTAIVAVEVPPGPCARIIEIGD